MNDTDTDSLWAGQLRTEAELDGLVALPSRAADPVLREEQLVRRENEIEYGVGLKWLHNQQLVPAEGEGGA